MGLLSKLFWAETPDTALRETAQQYADSYELLQERLAELELALEDQDWVKLAGSSDRELSRDGLRKICKLARVMWIKNPVIKQGVGIQTRYVFAQGVTVRARHAAVNDVLQAFLDDTRNRQVFSGHQARMQLETTLQIDANLFFAFFPNVATGKVQVRTIPFDEIEEVITNPEDAAEPWYYRRRWQQGTTYREALYPDWRYAKPPASYDGLPVEQVPVYHVATNKLQDMRFGVSEVYASLDWARAYKDFLSDWATIVRAYSKFAWQLTTKGGAKGVAAAKTKLGTTLSASSGRETNPAPVAGSTFIATEGVSMQPIKTAGATTSADDGRRMLLMAAAGMGISEHYFGDPSTGNLATAKSMERPMELMFVDRQALWADILRAICDYVIDWAVRAPSGTLHQQTTVDDEGLEVITLPLDDETGEPIDRSLTITFPPILEKDTAALVGAFKTVATLDGQAPQSMDLKTFLGLTLPLLGVADVDEMLANLFPEEEEATPEDGRVAEALRQLAEATRELAVR